VLRGEFGTMVAVDVETIRDVPIIDACDSLKMVDVNSDTVRTARDLGVSFGD
jgi:6-phosphofructokinase 1